MPLFKGPLWVGAAGSLIHRRSLTSLGLIMEPRSRKVNPTVYALGEHISRFFGNLFGVFRAADSVVAPLKGRQGLVRPLSSRVRQGLFLHVRFDCFRVQMTGWFDATTAAACCLRIRFWVHYVSTRRSPRALIANPRGSFSPIVLSPQKKVHKPA